MDQNGLIFVPPTNASSQNTQDARDKLAELSLWKLA